MMMAKRKALVRREFRDSVFERDNYCCVHCGAGPFYEMANDIFDAHHITDRSEMPNGGYVKENGITLCKEALGLSMVDGEDGLPDVEFDNESCHMKAEKFHITEGKEWTKGMHPDDLYKKIGSSKELAIKQSEKL